MKSRMAAGFVSIVAMTMLVAGCGKGSSGGDSSSLAGALGAKGCDKTSTVKTYSASIGDVSKFAYIYPMGGLIASHVTPIDHVYVYYPEDTETHTVAAGSYLVTSPADGVVANIEDFQKTNQYPYPDHRVVIAHSCDFFSVFIHIGDLATGIEVGAKVTAGQTLADDSYSPGYDFSTFDSSVNLDFINPASYSKQDAWKIHTANPFNYFPADAKALLEEKSLRATAPFDGKLDWDQAGTAQGNWFVQDTNGYFGNFKDQGASFDNHGKIAHGYWDTHLAIAPHAVDGTAFIYSIGDFAGCPCQFMSKGNIDPTTLTSSMTAPQVIELVEYEYVDAKGQPMDEPHPTKGYTLKPRTDVVGLLALQVMADGTMKVEKLPDAHSAADFTGFTDKAQIYVR